MKACSLRFALLSLALLAAAGCSHDAVTDCCPRPPEISFPETPDELASEFMRVYEARDFAAFARMLHPEAVTLLQASTVNNYPELGSTIDRVEDLRIHERMFSGQNLTDPYGNTVPACQTIRFQTFAPQGVWALSAPNDPIPYTQNALYDVVILIDRGQTPPMLKVQGTLRFYVSARDSMVYGVTRQYCQLRGLMDLTLENLAASSLDKPAYVTSWGSAKALWR